MKHMMILSLCGLAAVLVMAGCASPKLASRAMKPHELEWSLGINASYPAWRPPFLSPVESVGKAAGGGLSTTRTVDLSADPLGSEESISPATDDVEFVPAEDGK